MTFVASGELRLWVERIGDPADPAVLLIAGAEAQGIGWPSPLVDRLVEAGLQVIRYDHRDTGESDSVDFDESPYAMVDLVEDAVAVLDGLDVESAHVVGASMGGVIAQRLAATYPGRVLTLTLMSTTAAGHRGLPPPDASFLARSEEIATLPRGTGARRGRRAGVRTDERRPPAVRREGCPRPGPTAFRSGPRLDEVRQSSSHWRTAQRAAGLDRHQGPDVGRRRRGRPDLPSSPRRSSDRRHPGRPGSASPRPGPHLLLPRPPRTPRRPDPRLHPRTVSTARTDPAIDGRCRVGAEAIVRGAGAESACRRQGRRARRPRRRLRIGGLGPGRLRSGPRPGTAA